MAGLVSSTWGKDPTKLAILRALYSCQARLGHDGAAFRGHIVDALAQKSVCFLHSYHWKWRRYIDKLFSGPFWSRYYPLVPVQISRYLESSHCGLTSSRGCRSGQVTKQTQRHHLRSAKYTKKADFPWVVGNLREQNEPRLAYFICGPRTHIARLDEYRISQACTGHP